MRTASKPHRLPRDLVVSLTSYTGRFDTLPLTLSCLLDQTIRPDKIVLWVSQRDFDHLPGTIHAFTQCGLEIRVCDDLRSFKKLIPALMMYPNAYIATADDDLYYPRTWLEELVRGVDPDAPTIVCHRAHRVVRTPDGIAPYLSWEFDVQDVAARKPSTDIMPTTGAGALYPPGCLHPIVIDRDSFQRLCPDGDDLWFYWCARLAGTPIKKIGKSMPLLVWPGSQSSALWESNKDGGNDRMISALLRKFGIGMLEPSRSHSSARGTPLG